MNNLFFTFFAGIGDQADKKTILNFFADVSETIVFGRRVERVSIEDKRRI